MNSNEKFQEFIKDKLSSEAKGAWKNLDNESVSLDGRFKLDDLAVLYWGYYEAIKEEEVESEQ